MAYIPKSKYKVLITTGEEYITSLGEEYVGSYILTGGKAYIGSDISDIGSLLYPFTTPNLNTNVVHTINSHNYNKSNGNMSYKNLSNKKHIIPTKRIPIKKDYVRGYYERYFAKRNNSVIEYYEINYKTFKSILNRNDEYDYNLYSVDNIRWALKGDVIKANSNILKLKEKTYPNLSSLFYILDEFQIKTEEINQPQQQKPTEYIIPKKIQSQITPPQSTPSTGGGTSGGGGGGY